MDGTPTDKTTVTDDRSRSSERARRGRARAQSLARRAMAPQAGRFETPEWLERSFVLPLTEPETVATSSTTRPLPTQVRPRHDDLDATVRPAARPELSAFLRPATPQIDFALVVRRADLARAHSRVARTSASLCGLSLVGFLLVAAPWLLAVSAVLLIAAGAALVAQVRLASLPLPHLDR